MTTTHNAALHLPSSQTIALAIAVVRSKPDHLDVQDYLTALKRHIVNAGHRAGRDADGLRMDRTSFWHSQYERVSEALHVARCDNSNLRQEVEELESQLKVVKTFVPVKKRKAVDDEVAKLAAAVKRRKAGDASGEEDDHVTSETVTNRELLMFSLFEILQSINSPDAPSSSDILYHVMRAATSLSAVLGAGSETGSPCPLRDACAIGSRAIELMIDGFRTVSSSPSTTPGSGSAIYTFMQMYSKMLGIVMIPGDEACSCDLIGGNSTAKASRAKKRYNTRASRAAHPVRPQRACYKALLGILGRCILQLDMHLALHRELFDGMAYDVLDRLGAALYTITFGHRRPDTLEEEILGEAVTGRSKATLEQQSETSLETVMYQAPYLISLLKCIVKKGTASDSREQSKIVTTGASALPQWPVKGSLSERTKARLQQTVVACTFGVEGIDDGPLTHTLKPPRSAALDVPALPDARLTSDPAWLKSEAWKVLGWDILAAS